MLSQIFEVLRNQNPKFAEKIVLISGDIESDGLAIDRADETALINEVDIIFHCAANVRFDDPLKQAININVLGTLRILKLAEKVKNLKVFSYMSTAFSQCYQEELEERYYPSNLNVFNIIQKTKDMDRRRWIVSSKACKFQINTLVECEKVQVQTEKKILFTYNESCTFLQKQNVDKEVPKRIP